MTPDQTAQLFGFLTEAVKLIGPAAVTGYVTYRVTKTQSDARLAELQTGHSYKARAEMFGLHRQDLERLYKQSDDVARGVGQILGLIAGAKLGEPDRREELSVIASLATTYSRAFLPEVESVDALFAEMSLGERRELIALRRIAGELDWNAAVEVTAEAVSTRLLRLQEATALLQRCHAVSVRRQMEKALASYV